MIQQEMTQQEIQAVADEIQGWLNSAYTDGHIEWEIKDTEHLYTLDAFLVRCTSGVAMVYRRDEQGKLLPVRSRTYWADNGFTRYSTPTAPEAPEEAAQ